MLTRSGGPDTRRSRRAGPRAVLLAAAVACGPACNPIRTPDSGSEAGGAAIRASKEFWGHWGDGRAELSGYRVTTSRYGEPREGRIVLIYVTEPMDARRWIKDDRGDVPERDRVQVLKLNHILNFRTGIYPYSVMTSVVAPVDGLFPERFEPATITFTAQEWCGQVFQRVRFGGGEARSELRSYFGDEGDKNLTVGLEPGTLAEDALLIQLRELDGPFAAGGPWKGMLLPSLWETRKLHKPFEVAEATITRADAERDGVAVSRFTLVRSERIRVYDVERAHPRRVLGWRSSDGEEARLVSTERLAYWQLNRPGDEAAAERLFAE